MHKPSSHKLQSDTKPYHSWNMIFVWYGRDQNLPLHQLLGPMQQFLGDLESGLLNLEAHHLALVIAKKTLDENHSRTAQKRTGNRVYFKNKQPGKWDLKQRPGYWIVCIECNGHSLHTENQAMWKTRSCNVKDVVPKPPVELWNINTLFGRAGRYINHPANLPTITLTDWRWELYSCT